MGKRCPYCRQIIADESLFCPECGKEFPIGKTCSFCGGAISDDDVYCPNCGVVVAQGKACPHCRASIDEDDVYCPNCGAKIDRDEDSSNGNYNDVCPNCRAAIDKDDMFCQNCGAKFNKDEDVTHSVHEEVKTEARHDSPKDVEANPTKPIAPLPLPTPSVHEEEACDYSEDASPKKYGKWIFIAIIAIALIGGGLYFFLNRSNNKWESKGEIVTPVTPGRKSLCGTIGEIPITMELNIEASNVDGSLYYNKYGPSNKLIVSGSVHNNEIEMTEHNKDGMETGHFKGKYSNGVFQGEYVNYKGDAYSFKLCETEDAVVKETEDAQKADEAIVKESITKRLKEIFDNVMNGRDNYDESYFSSEFNIIYKKVEEIDNRFLENGEQGFWDTGFWDMSQDCDGMKITVNDVYDIKDNEALVKVTFTVNYYGGTSNTLNEEIKVILEDGKWVLDDLHGYKEQMKDFCEDNKDFQPLTIQSETDWLQGHWVYERGNYRGHTIIQGDKIIQYSSINPERDEHTFRIEDGAIRARLIDGLDLVVPIDFVNHTIDYGDGCWMHKVNE